MGPKFARLFLYAATGIASSARPLPRRVARAAVGAPGRTTATPAKPARHGWGGSGRQTPARSPGRSASTSTARWGSRGLWPLSATTPAAAGIRSWGACAAGREQASPPRPPGPPRPSPDATDRRKQLRCQLDATPLPWSGRFPTVPWPVADATPTSSQIHVVSCGMYRRFPYITSAKLNRSGLATWSVPDGAGDCAVCCLGEAEPVLFEKWRYSSGTD